jgi:hypothetical protein
MQEVRVLSPTGACGAGYLESSFEAALALNPHIIGMDAGSTDPGPSYLGSGKFAFPRAAIKRDLRVALKGARRLDVPFIVGSAGTAGGDAQVDVFAEIIKEIAAEEGLSFKLALLHSEQEKTFVLQKLNEGRIKPLDPAPHLDEDVIQKSEHIVGMMGAEPFIEALKAGAQVIIGGRASDTAIFSSFPLMNGISPAMAWHAAKILECGAAAVVNRKTPDCMFAWVRNDHFVVQAPAPDLRCTPQSIASHSLYENSNPYTLVESSGVLDLSESKYEAVDDRTVKVSGSRFNDANSYTVKIEGAELVGYQSVLIGSVRDELIIGQIDDWLDKLRTRVLLRCQMLYGEGFTEDSYLFHIRVYGKNGTMGSLEPETQIRSHELCLIFEVTASTQELANTLAGIVRHQALHLPIPEWSGLITGVACPYNQLERGSVYRFNLNHVIEPDDPMQMFRLSLHDVETVAMKNEVHA